MYKKVNATRNVSEKEHVEKPTSTLVSRNITIQGRRTSVRLEPEMWTALSEIADREQCAIHDVCTIVSLKKRDNTSLTAAIRVFIMLYFRAATTEAGHKKAGHGDFQFMVQRAKISQVKPLSKRVSSSMSTSAVIKNGSTSGYAEEACAI